MTKSALKRPRNRAKRKDAQMANKYVTVFTDASYCAHTGCYGWAVWIKYGNPAKTLRLVGGGRREANTNRSCWVINGSAKAEWFALDTAIHALHYYGVPVREKIVVIQTDCEGLVNKINTNSISALAESVHVRHVKGHNGKRNTRSCVNTWCDKAARRKMREQRKKFSEGQQLSMF